MDKKGIKKILYSLAKKDNLLNNSELYDIIDKYKNISNVSEESIVNEYNLQKTLHIEKEKQIEEYNNLNNCKNEFNKKGIYTINDLFKFMNENFEYGGILSLNNERIKLPFGPVNGVAKNNILIGYNDEYVFRPIIDMYIKIGKDKDLITYVEEQYQEKTGDICDLKEYQQIIYEVGEYVQKNMWKQRSISEILIDQISNCYESSYLVGEFFKINKIKYQKYIVGRYDNIFFSHMFITYQLDDKYYYFEHALNDFKGIFQYNSKQEMEQDIFVKFIYNDNYKLEQEIDFNNYFLKPIDDLDENSGFIEYFNYFSTIESIKLREKNYKILLKLTELVFNEILDIGAVYNINSKYFYSVIELPKKDEFYDVELWRKKIHKIMRRKIKNIIFYKKNKTNDIYIFNSLGGFYRLNNMLDLGDDNIDHSYYITRQKMTIFLLLVI